MDGLLNEWGMSAFWPVMVLGAVPLAVIGWLLRRRARTRAYGIALATESRRKIRDVAAGAVTLVGVWRIAGNGQTLLEEESGSAHRVCVERDGDAPAITDGATVLVVGCATHQLDDSRPTGYRGASKVWVVDTRGDGHFVSPAVDALERAAGAARRRAGVGAMLFAAGIAVALASCVVAYRAARQDDVGAYGSDTTL